MARFTKALRQEIIREFCARNGAEFDAILFEQEVRKAGETHPAYAWFNWNTAEAALEYRIGQAREFASGLTVTFTIEEVGTRGKITIREVQMPLVMSPMEGRRQGGGYFLSNPEDPDHMAEFCRQGAGDLAVWLRRYRAAVIHSGGQPASIEKQIGLLEEASSVSEDIEEAV